MILALSSQGLVNYLQGLFAPLFLGIIALCAIAFFGLFRQLHNVSS